MTSGKPEEKKPVVAKVKPLDSPEHFINRELSWLEFNQRVLEEGLDPSVPLLERLKFLCIVSSNLDEFFEIRVAGLKQQKQIKSIETAADGLTPSEALQKVSQRVRKLVEDQYRCYREELLPAMAAQHIHFSQLSAVSVKDKKYLADYFHREVLPVLTPLAIDPGHPFPQLLNKSLNVVVELLSEEKGPSRLAVVQVPRILPRVVPLPRASNGNEFVFIGNIIQAHAGALFHGMKVKGVHQFRVTRNSDLYFDEEEAENLLRTIEDELRKINRGKAVRLEVQADCPKAIASQLLRIFNLEDQDLFVVNGPINLTRMFPVIAELDRPDLKFRPFVAPVLPELRGADPFTQIRKGDILLHHPYDNFQSVVDFIGHAAEDPRVLAIKQTLYRTGADSSIVPSLMEASQNGKQVTVLVELKARFDEAANIRWARAMQEAGVHVVYGMVGYKTHCKVAMAVRRDDDGLRRYVHLATGNYHPGTAKFYTDVGILTCDTEIGEDVAELFNLLTGVANFPGMKKLLVAPWTMHDDFVRKIQREIDHAKHGRPAAIFAKLNSLVDAEIIEALYQASIAGIPVRLMVRGINCLRSKLKGVSENIEVRSIVGQFLEHSRIYRFENGGNPEMFLGSADWMPRNFYRRVETAFPLVDPQLREKVETIIEIYWQDNLKARVQQPDGFYKRLKPAENEDPKSAQGIFLAAARMRRKQA